MISQNAGRILPESERTNRHGSADVSHSSDADAGYGQIAFGLGRDCTEFVE